MSGISSRHRRMRTVHILVQCSVLLVLSTALSAAQKSPEPLLKAVDLQADVVILRQAYETLHPGLYRYNSKAQMDAAFDVLNQDLGRDQTLQDAFLAFSKFAAKVQCGHTQANPFNQSKAVVEKLLQSSARVPFYFEWLDRRMTVTRDFTPDRSLSEGTEIVQINGIPAHAILDRIMTIARADGANDSKRIAQLNVTGDSEYEPFDIYFPMFFPQTGPRMELIVRRPGNTGTKRVAVNSLTFEQRIAPIKTREDQRNRGSEVLFEWRYLDKGEAYLKMATWALYKSKWDWKSWLNEKLNEAAQKNAPALILDLRGNEGGDDVGNEILPHLIGAPMPLSSMQRLVRYRKVPDNLLPYLDTWDKSFRDWGSSAVDLLTPWPTAPANVSYFKLIRYDETPSGEVIRPSSQRFLGKVIVLIDATNSSATFQFAQVIQMHHLGTLIGQPTGGSQRGIDGGAFFFLRLPHSGIEMDLPLIGTFPSTPMPDAGITPDVTIRRTAADIATGRDPVLEAALAAAMKD